jgi:hypothetical protein
LPRLRRKKPTLPTPGLPATVDQLANFGLGHRVSIYAAIRRGEIPVKRIGRKILIPAEVWMQFGMGGGGKAA